MKKGLLVKQWWKKCYLCKLYECVLPSPHHSTNTHLQSHLLCHFSFPSNLPSIVEGALHPSSLFYFPHLTFLSHSTSALFHSPSPFNPYLMEYREFHFSPIFTFSFLSVLAFAFLPFFFYPICQEVANFKVIDSLVLDVPCTDNDLDLNPYAIIFQDYSNLDQYWMTFQNFGCPKICTKTEKPNSRIPSHSTYPHQYF